VKESTETSLKPHKKLGDENGYELLRLRAPKGKTYAITKQISPSRARMQLSGGWWRQTAHEPKVEDTHLFLDRVSRLPSV
jgi:hypothetical protein